MRMAAPFPVCFGLMLWLLCAALAQADPISLQISSWNLTWNAHLLTTSLTVNGVDSQNRQFSLSLNNGILNFNRGTLEPDTLFALTGNGESFRGESSSPYALIGALNVSGLPRVTSTTPPGDLPVSLSMSGRLTLALFSAGALKTLYDIMLTGLTGAGIYTVGTASDLDSMQVSGKGGAGTLVPASVPEPTTLLLIGSGLIALGVRSSRGRR